jgi:hypothetical protein
MAKFWIKHHVRLHTYLMFLSCASSSCTRCVPAEIASRTTTHNSIVRVSLMIDSLKRKSNRTSKIPDTRKVQRIRESHSSSPMDWTLSRNHDSKLQQLLGSSHHDLSLRFWLESKKKKELVGADCPMRQECGSACVARRATDDATPNKLQAWQLAALCGGVAATRGLCRPHNPLANPKEWWGMNI